MCGLGALKTRGIVDARHAGRDAAAYPIAFFTLATASEP